MLESTGAKWNLIYCIQNVTTIKMEHFQVTQSQNAEQMWYNTHNAHPDRDCYEFMKQLIHNVHINAGSNITLLRWMYTHTDTSSSTSTVVVITL